MALMNYTGRESIDRSLIDIIGEKNAPVLTVYLKTSPELKNNPKYAGCMVSLDAIRSTKAERRELGAVEDLPQSVKVVFKDFPSSNGVSFRLKVVRPIDKMIFGVASNLHEKEEKSSDNDTGSRKPLLPLNWAEQSDNLKGRFWKLNFKVPSNPILLLAKGKFSSLGEVNQPAFQALAFPSIMREILTYAFIVRFENPPQWADDWAKLAKYLGCDELPVLSDRAESPQEIEEHLDAVAEWIDDVAASFAEDCRLVEITSEFKRS